MIEYIILITLLLVSGAAAILFKNMLYAAMGLAVCSIMLAFVMFKLNAPWAGVFELSVCAGLITVLFASTVSMVKTDKKYFVQSKMSKYLPLAVIIFGLILLSFGKPFLTVLMAEHKAHVSQSVGDIIWNVRFKDLIAQLAILVAGVVAIKAFFGKHSDEVEEKK